MMETRDTDMAYDYERADLRSDETKYNDERVNKARLAERERCAQIAEKVASETSDGEGEFYIACKIANAIRVGTR